MTLRIQGMVAEIKLNEIEYLIDSIYNRIMISARHLTQILAVHRCGTFNRAAAELNLTQPALTSSIQKLEETLGFALFVRSRRGVKLTVFGQHIVATAPGILSRLQRLSDELNLIAAGERGEIKLSAGPVLIHGVMRRVIPAFCRKFPNVHLSLRTDPAQKILADVAAGRIDLGIATTAYLPDGDEVMTREILNEPITFAVRAGHPLAGRRALTRQDLFGFPLALPEVPVEMQQWMVPDGPDGKPHLCLQTDHYELLLRTVRESDAITGAPGHLLAPYIAEQSLVALDYIGPSLNWSAKAIYRQTSALSPAFTALLELVETEVARSV